MHGEIRSIYTVLGDKLDLRDICSFGIKVDLLEKGNEVYSSSSG
jgi:hypothetical protein